MDAESEIVEDLGEADEAEAHAEAHQAAAVGDEGDGRDGTVALELGHVGVPGVSDNNRSFGTNLTSNTD